MSEASKLKQPRVFTGRHMLAIMVAFFGVVIAVNIMLAVMASRSNTGLVVEDSYKAGLTYDRDMAKAKANAELDIHPKLYLSSDVLRVALSNSNGAPVDVSGIALTLGHPVSAGTDEVMNFKYESKGVFIARVKLTEGVWEGELIVTLPSGEAWTRPIKLVVKP
jgi:nitrogen fixation protein FixH